MCTLRFYTIYILIYTSVFSVCVSCQRELSPDPEPVSAGYISKDSNGNCQALNISGIYTKGKKLSDSNYIEAEVNVTSAGSYSILTDTVNGYYFKAGGKFTGNGIKRVKLVGYGNPLLADTNYFILKYNQSTCQARIVVIDTAVETATFTLDGTPGTCMNDTIFGNYIPGLSLDTGCKVKLSLNVITPGAYTIVTNTTNGYNFSASGIFLNPGAQQIFLNASGTPLNEGTDVFTVTASISSCSFSVNVLTPVIVNRNDYFPLSANSFWIYDDLINIGDTIKKTLVDSTTINAGLYKILREDVHYGGPFQYYYRKAGLDYFEYAAPNKYTTFFQYKQPVNADIPFLKENITTGFVWESPEYVDTSSNGDIIRLKYNFSCIDANAILTLNGKAFTDVYKIKMLPEIKTNNSNYTYTTEEYLFYYAKGIGLIYLKKTLNGFIQNEIQIRSWKVN